MSSQENNSHDEYIQNKKKTENDFRSIHNTRRRNYQAVKVESKTSYTIKFLKTVLTILKIR